MKAAVVREFGQPLVMEDRPIPSPGPGQVTVRMEASGLCHTDIHAANGDWPVKPSPPFVPGHEGVGLVHATGEGVSSLTIGQRVAVPWLGYACGTCKYCLTGWETLCLEQLDTGYSVDGCYAEYFLAEAAFAAKVPDGVDPFDAAPLSCAGVTTYKAVKVGNVRPADLVAISGVGGLGHLAVQYAAAGYWRAREGAEKFQATISAEYPDQLCTLHEGNIGLADDCRRVVREVIDQHGRLDILVNNAGITIDRTAAKMCDEDWQHVIAVNLSGTFFIAQAALEHMIERGTGRIVSVSSVIGETGNIGQANYAASKSGLFGLTKSLAREAIFQLNRAERPVGDGVGLTVNAVTPGFVATDMMATIPDKVLARIKGQIPVGRLARPEEIARVVGFLAADESAYITGQIWAVNGGLDM